MKKILILFCLSLFAFSCNNESIDQQEQSIDLSNIDVAKIEAMRTMDEASQKIVFRLLSNEEKHYLRLVIMNEFIAENSFSPQQFELINELKSNFTIDIYEKRDKAEYFKNIYADQWIEKSLEYFTETEIYELTTAYFKFTENDSVNRLIRECKCHVGSIITCRKKTTVSLSPSDGPEVSLEYGVCSDQYACNYPEDDDGQIDMDGCGFLGWFLCNGNCE